MKTSSDNGVRANKLHSQLAGASLPAGETRKVKMREVEISKVQILRNSTMGHIESLRKMWLGEMLTLAEGTFNDLEQRKGFKKIVTRIFWSEDENWTKYIRNEFKRYAEAIGEKIEDDEVIGIESAIEMNPYN